MRAGIFGVALIASACAAAPPHAAERDLEPMAPASLDGEHDFTIAWHGARIGDAVERVSSDADGVRLVRRERTRVLRNGALSGTDVELTVVADRTLVASRIEWREMRSEGPPRVRRATRDALGWELVVDDEPVRRAPADAVPAELVPLLVRRDGEFHGNVLVAGSGLAIARLDVATRGPRALRATTTTAAGALIEDVTLDGDGVASVIAGSDGMVVRRVTRDEAAAAFDPPEVVDTAAIALDRDAPADLRAPIVVEIDGARKDPWRVSLAPAGAPAPAAVATIVHDVYAGDAGDCTAHALAFVARANAAGIATRVVTGWRVDGARLVRHRWAMAWDAGARAWIAVDPSYDEAPAAPRLIELAVGGATAEELAAADRAFDATAGATARLVERVTPSAPDRR